jgi:hypothetical protein
MSGLAFVTRFEYTLSLDEGDEADEVLGDARRFLEGVGVGGIVDFVEKARGEVGTLGSRGEREQRSGDEERGDDTAGV